MRTINLPSGFVLQRTDQGGGYVAPPGSAKSYVQDVLGARVFKTRAEADADRCVENEIVVEVR
jgi:hypothetical protein